VLFISLLKYRTEKEDVFSFILYHIMGSQKDKWWLSCGDRQLQHQILAAGEWRWFPIGGMMKIICFLPLCLADSVFSEVWVIKFTDRK